MKIGEGKVLISLPESRMILLILKKLKGDLK